MSNYKQTFSNEVLKLNVKSQLPPSIIGENGQNAWHDIVHFFFLFKKRDENIHSYMFSPLDIEYYKKRFQYDVLQFTADEFGNYLDVYNWYDIVKDWKTSLSITNSNL